MRVLLVLLSNFDHFKSISKSTPISLFQLIDIVLSFPGSLGEQRAAFRMLCKNKKANKDDRNRIVKSNLINIVNSSTRTANTHGSHKAAV